MSTTHTDQNKITEAMTQRVQGFAVTERCGLFKLVYLEQVPSKRLHPMRGFTTQNIVDRLCAVLDFVDLFEKGEVVEKIFSTKERDFYHSYTYRIENCGYGPVDLFVLEEREGERMPSFPKMAFSSLAAMRAGVVDAIGELHAFSDPGATTTEKP